ncbi:hypothetical protein LEP1GSC058_3043 [Leptospira fainei serovar Hurstbridge str. BUT 6]|uniref:Uncharacterized protein n=1 Tax=Leptospira fainei serovar Hurstbridge str. BUT 6 TaxID=1193011 RepID=S3V0J8_9LEPT|nr:hypothetical protein LEP1GSC058_3043 [Leptospira fainei serovar Hurstbridge str. BUT 6]
MKITEKGVFLATILKSFLLRPNPIKTRKFDPDLGGSASNLPWSIFFFGSAASLIVFNIHPYFLCAGNLFHSVTERLEPVSGSFRRS